MEDEKMEVKWTMWKFISNSYTWTTDDKFNTRRPSQLYIQMKKLQEESLQK